MRPAGNLAGVEFISPPRYHNQYDQWAEIITESGYFFTKSAMRYFGSRIIWDSLTALDDGVFAFITSEQDRPVTISSGTVPAAWDGARRFTVRAWSMDHGIIELSEFGEFATLKAAKDYLLRGRSFARYQEIKAAN